MRNLPAIEARSVSKTYRRGIFSVTTLRDEIASMIERRRSGIGSDQYHALRDVSFELPTGQILGVVGPNGSGKTTLMKVLASITEPTGGEILLRGRVGSLLEVGAGFDPELDGIENIYLNGAILGLSKAQTRARLDKIIQFANIGKALDTQVKRYSSGMYIRLAFAVAAHLDAEILLVDEVLAVGDVAFQRLCLATMRDLASAGRSIIFVSHNMGLVTQLCHRAMYLEKGSIGAIGTVDDIADMYTRRLAASRHWISPQEVKGIVTEFEICGKDGLAGDRIEFGMGCELHLGMQTQEPVGPLSVAVFIRDEEGRLISTADSECEGIAPFALHSGGTMIFDAGALSLLPGNYSAGFEIRESQTGQVISATESAMVFMVQPACLPGATISYGRKDGLIHLVRGAKFVSL
jgi:lipopolysaccharide transport system ATP-binding protein